MSILVKECCIGNFAMKFTAPKITGGSEVQTPILLTDHKVAMQVLISRKAAPLPLSNIEN